MIVRVFESHIRPGTAAEYERLLREVSIPLIRAQGGLVACYTARPAGSGEDAYVMVSVWRDLDALKAFTGEDYERPIIPDDREVAIIERATVRHFEALDPG